MIGTARSSLAPLPLSVQQLNALNVATSCLTSLSITSSSLKITVSSGLAVTVKVRTHMIVQLNRTEINWSELAGSSQFWTCTAHVFRTYKNYNYLRQGGYVFVGVCLFVCLLAALRENFRTDLHKIFREGWQWANEQTVKFWWRSGSLSGYRDCFPDSSLLGDTESGINRLRYATLQCMGMH